MFHKHTVLRPGAVFDSRLSSLERLSRVVVVAPRESEVCMVADYLSKVMHGKCEAISARVLWRRLQQLLLLLLSLLLLLMLMVRSFQVHACVLASVSYAGICGCCRDSAYTITACARGGDGDGRL